MTVENGGVLYTPVDGFFCFSFLFSFGRTRKRKAEKNRTAMLGMPCSDIMLCWCNAML